MHHLEQQLRREQACIDAIHRSRTRIPLASLFRRRPWRSPGGIRGAVDGMSGRPFRVAVRNGWEWLSKTHDCSDPVVACSCSGGFRFPAPLEFRDDGERSDIWGSPEGAATGEDPRHA